MERKRKYVAICMLVATLFITVVPINAAGCGNWYVSSVGMPTCRPLSCGPHSGLPLYRQTVYNKRKCINNANQTYYETKTTEKALGCC